MAATRKQAAKFKGVLPMRSLMVPAALAAFFSASLVAFAAQTTTGTVKEFDLKAKTLTLSDGTVYELPGKFKNSGIKNGEKVQLSWDMKDGKHMATKLKIIK
jgi:Cu/Ag efflux protein CusF